jgi:hypothetical protein
MGNTELPQKNYAKYLGSISVETDTGKAHQNQNKTAQPKSEKDSVTTWKKINTINRKQTPIQSSTQTHMDLWNSVTENSLQFQHRNPPVHSERALVYNHMMYEVLHRAQ